MNSTINQKTKFIDLGLVDYKEAWDFQTDLYSKIRAVKIENRNLPPESQKPTDNYLIFCQHPHVYTLGRNGKENNLLIKKENLGAINATYYPINRGGDITYHGPGQLVAYPILDLENFFTDMHQYMRLLEESVIQTLQELNIKSGRISGLTGVWCGVDDEKTSRKICAMGVKMGRWVTMHGLALNVDPNMNYFDHIIACGIPGKGVTSIKMETGKQPDDQLVRNILKNKIGTLFGMTF